MHDKKEWMIVYLSLPTNHKSKPLAYIYIYIYKLVFSLFLFYFIFYCRRYYTSEYCLPLFLNIGTF